MRNKLKIFSKTIVTVSMLLILGSCVNAQESQLPLTEVQITKPVKEPNRSGEFKSNLQKAKDFLKANPSYNSSLVILIDMRIPSGKKRFFVYDLKGDSIKTSGLVAHGSGSLTDQKDSLSFSNVPNSYQTSLGNYKIGSSYTGNFGKSYKLHGLDATNSKALQRLIVLHPYSCVPDEEQNYPICLSLGCPMVSNSFMEELYPIIDGSRKPVLMRIYY